MDFKDLSFDKKVDLLSDWRIKFALKDGEINEIEKSLFKEVGDVEISNSDISDIENSFLELESYIENDKDSKNANNTSPTEKEANNVITPKNGETTKTTTKKNSTTKTKFKSDVAPANVAGESSESLKSKLADAQGNLLDVNEGIKEAKTTQKEAENEYLKLLKDAAKNDKELKTLETDRSKKESEIAKQEESISKLDKDVNTKERILSKHETSLSNLTAPPQTISKTVTDKDGNKKTVTEKNPKYQEYLEKKQQLEETVANTKKELEQLKQNRIEAEEQKLKLEEELADIDLQIEEHIAEKEEFKEVQTALDKYQKANETLQNLEAKKIQIEKNIQTYKNEIPKAEAREKAEEAKKAEDAKKAEEANKASSANRSGSTGKSGGVGGANSSGNSNRANSTNNTNHKDTKTEKEEELKKSEDKFKEKENVLKNIYSGEDKDISAAKANANKSFENLQKVLEANGHSDLANKIGNVKTQLDSKMAELDGINSQILAQENALSAATNGITKNASMISTYEGMLSELKGTDTSKLNGEQKAELSEKTKQLQQEIQTAKTTTTENLQKQQKAAQTRIAELKKQKAPLEEEVAKLNSELENLLSQVPADCKTQADSFKTAQDDYAKLKETKETAAKGELDTARTEKNKADLEVAKLKDAENVQKYKVNTSTMDGSYNLNGVNYNCLMDQSELNSLASKIQNGGNGNKWGHPDKCLSFAYSYGVWVDDPSKVSTGARSSQYPDAGKYSEYSGSKNDVLAKVKSELDEGRPVVIQVNGNSSGTSRHYVTVVGYNQNAGGSLTESDLLILDTYDGKVEGMGDNGARFMISGKDTGRDYGYQLYLRNY